MIKKFALLVLFTAMMFSAYPHFMSAVWPQKRIEGNNFGNPQSSKKVLIAGKGSEFRDIVINHLVEKLQKDSVYISIVDLSEIKSKNPGDWNAILLVNRCVAFDYDNLVSKYVKKYPKSQNIVIFTTSADPRGCNLKSKLSRKLKLDAYSSASVKENVNPAVEAIYKMLKKYLEK
jgi:hypothetical protein